MIDEEALKKLVKAGEIAKRVREYAEKLVKPGAKLLDIAELLEKRIRELGGEPAFPVNIGINEVAAHYTPVLSDVTMLPDNSIVKIDIGVHVDGFIADTAVTISLNPAFEGLVEAARLALEKALEAFRPGIRASELGSVIEKAIKSAGYKSIKNLSGHGMARYVIHSGVTIPNFGDVFSWHRLEEGVYAIEPFATNGVGLVEEAPLVTIYALKQKTRRLLQQAEHFYNKVYGERRTLPFTLRWYVRSADEYSSALEVLNLLKKCKCLVEYPVLVEKGRGLVSQFEHTIVVLKNEVVVTTA